MKDQGQEKKNKSGSLKNSEPEFLVAGKLRKSHGLHGEMWIEVLTDFPELLNQGSDVFVGDGFNKIKIQSFRQAGKLGLIQFEGYENPESLRLFNNAYLYFESKSLPDLEGEAYYHHDLIGLKVCDTNGAVIGVVAEILETGANDVYVIKPRDGDREILIPAIKSVIQKIDIESKRMVINPQEWDK